MDHVLPESGQDSGIHTSTEDITKELVSGTGSHDDACLGSCSVAASGFPSSSAPTKAVHHSTPSANRRLQRKDGLGLTRDTRYTVEGVLDQRTIRHILHVVRAASVCRIFGAISCGKESNVYFALGENLAGDTSGNGHPAKESDDTQGKQGSASSWLRPFAMKVYRTSILAFKDRSRYVQGDFRFNNAYSRNHNPRKMVEVWTLKEYRNLRRLNDAGIPSPRPIAFKSNVLLLEFVGDTLYLPEGQAVDSNFGDMRDCCRGVPECDEVVQEEERGDASPLSKAHPVCTASAADFEDSCSRGLHTQSAVWTTGSFSRSFSESQLVYNAAPRLKDLVKYFNQSHFRCGRWCTRLPWSVEDVAASWRYLYVQVVYLLRAMYVRCQMIHGDLSEFNLLLSRRRVVVIDVSQAIQRDHPRALDFLKRDCKNVTSFFAKNIQLAEQRLCNQNSEAQGRDECSCTKGGADTAFPIIDLNEAFHRSFRILTVRELFEFVVSASLPQQLFQELKHSNLVQGTEPSHSLFEGVLVCFALFLLRREAEGDCGRAVQCDGDDYDVKDGEALHGDSVEDAVFLNSWVPTSLHGVGELDAIERLMDGVPEEAEESRLMIHKKMTEKFDEWNLSSDDSVSGNSVRHGASRSSNGSSAGVQLKEHTGESICGTTSSHASETSCDDSDSESAECEKFTGKIPVGVDRKEWKRMVKEQNRERRMHKIPKKVKKRFKKNTTKK